MKRIELRKNVRIGVIIILVLVTIVSLLILYNAYRSPDAINKEIIITEYSQSSNFGYTVNLNHNKLYEVATIVGENSNQTYFTKIVRDISTVFTYKFVSTGGTNIKGNYDVTAVLSTDTWEKKFILVHKKEFNGVDKINFNEVAVIDINYYNNVLTNITKEIDVQPKDSRLMLIYNINTVITKDGEQSVESFIPVITITSTKGAFNVKGDIIKNNESAIKKIERDIQFDVLERRIEFTIISIVMIFIVSIFIAITKSKNKDMEDVNKIEKNIRDIKKKYGELIIYSKDSKLPVSSHIVTIDLIEDLVKVAEQLDEPIINSGTLYYIYDGSTIYMYNTDKIRRKNNS